MTQFYFSEPEEPEETENVEKTDETESLGAYFSHEHYEDTMQANQIEKTPSVQNEDDLTIYED